MNYLSMNDCFCPTGDLETSRGIIEALGGTAAMATIGVGATALSNWRKHGIPRLRWADVMDLAVTRGVDGITTAVLRTACANDAKPRATAASGTAASEAPTT
jgi:hypothetical protein